MSSRTTMLLLTTKLHLPSRCAALVSRTRLLDKLDRAPTHPLTLISAPAGFGKTTLLADWISPKRISPHPLRFACVALDDGDNDPTRFWSYVCMGLNSASPGVATTALSLLQARPSPPIEAVLTVLLNDLAARDEMLVVILDDYHVIHASAIHRSLQFLLDHLS